MSQKLMIIFQCSHHFLILIIHQKKDEDRLHISLLHQILIKIQFFKFSKKILKDYYFGVKLHMHICKNASFRRVTLQYSYHLRGILTFRFLEFFLQECLILIRVFLISKYLIPLLNFHCYFYQSNFIKDHLPYLLFNRLKIVQKPLIGYFWYLLK